MSCCSNGRGDRCNLRRPQHGCNLVQQSQSPCFQTAYFKNLNLSTKSSKPQITLLVTSVTSEVSQFLGSERVFQHSRSANPHSPQWGVDWAAPGFCCAATSAASTACACGDDLGLPLPSNIFKYHQMSTHCKANTSNTQTKPKCSRGPLRKPSKYKATTTKKEDNKQVRRKKW